PYVVHPFQVFRIAFEEYGVRDLASLLEALFHDVPELAGADGSKAFFDELRKEYPLMPNRLVEDLDFLTYFGKNESVERRMLNLPESRLVNLIAIKFADRQHNFKDIFEM